jgi:elongation factor Ts
MTVNKELLMIPLSINHIQELRQRTGTGAPFAVAASDRGERPTGEGLIWSYVHHNGRLGVLIEVNCETDFVARTAEFRTLVQHLAEQVAGAAPIAVSRDMLPSDTVGERRRAFEKEVRASRKPAHLVTKIVDGKMDAYFRSVVLLDQRWVREPDITVAELVRQATVWSGENIQVRRFARFHMGLA